jgi:hypothetical protein
MESTVLGRRLFPRGHCEVPNNAGIIFGAQMTRVDLPERQPHAQISQIAGVGDGRAPRGVTSEVDARSLHVMQ